MDCVDCHNRPAHRYLPPDRAVDQAFASGRLDRALPYLKREAVAVLGKQYNSTAEAVNGIGSQLDKFYQTHYAELYANKNASIKSLLSFLTGTFAYGSQ